MADDLTVTNVAARAPVDWDALERDARTEDEREWLQWVRALDQVADAANPPDDNRRPSSVTTLAPHSDAPAPTGVLGTWGKYVLREKVGEGGFGEVFRAWDPMLEHEVAIKVLHRRILDVRLKQALLLEGRALARIVHQNVVRVLAMEMQGDQIALCMEFVHGETLEDLVRRQGTLNAREAALIGEEVCRALAAVHTAGFVHRDIKARNVMRQQAGRIVLMDFGAGRYAADLQVPGREPNIGTPVYMAPELLAGDAATQASDVYSVGVLLYYLVTGDYPVEGRTIDDIRRAHMRGRRRSAAELRADLPTPFISVLEKALNPDPEARYPNSGALLAALSTLAPAADGPVAAPLPRVQAIVLGSAGAVLLLGLIGWSTSLEFTAALGHAAFVRETPLDWVYWGARASLGTFVTLGLVALVCAFALGVHRLVIASSPSARRLHRRSMEVLESGARRLRLHDPHIRGALLVVLGAASLAAAWEYFGDFFGNLLLAGNLWSAPAEKLALLAPSNRPFHWFFRKVFTGELIGASAALVCIWRFGPPVWDFFYRMLLAGAAAVALMTLLTLTVPYRVIYHPDFDVVRWDGTECYLLGSRDAESLLFCPSREQRLQLTSPIAGPPPVLLRHGENVFTAFGH